MTTALAPTESGNSTKRGSPRRRKRSERGPAVAFLTPSAIGLTVFILIPTILAIVTSLFDWPTFGDIRFSGLKNYVHLFQNGSGFATALLNTVLFTVIVVPTNLVLTLGMAFWIATSRLRRLYRVLFFLPVVTPTVATSIIWKLLYQPDGTIAYGAQLFGIHLPNLLASSSTALVAVVISIIWQGFGYNMLIFSAAIDQLPEDVLAAASIDGASGLRKMFQVKIPLLTPAIFFATTVTMIQSFQVFAEPFVMTAGGPGNATTTVVMNVYQTAFQSGKLGAASAPAMILFVLILIVTLVQWAGQRKWVHYE